MTNKLGSNNFDVEPLKRTALLASIVLITKSRGHVISLVIRSDVIGFAPPGNCDLATSVTQGPLKMLGAVWSAGTPENFGG